MNICLLIRALDRGGAELQLACLARGLAERQHAVTVVTYYGGGPLEAELRAAGVTLRSLGKSSRWQLWRPLVRLIGTVRATRADVLYAFLPTSNVLACLAKPFLDGTRVFAGVRASNMSLEHYDALAAWSYRVERRLLRAADRVVCNSAAAARLYAELVRRERLVVIRNGIDIRHYTPNPAGRAVTRRNWGIGEDERLIGLVARADPMKDHETFLAAAAAASSTDLGLRFVCITAGGEAAVRRLQKRAHELGVAERIRWEGACSDLAPIYPAFDLVTLTSAYGEGFPNVLAEAMACGVGCVATDVGDAAEIIGGEGRVVPPNDPQALAHAWLEQLAAQPAGEVNAVARQRIVDEFSDAAMIATTEWLLLKAVD